MVGGLNNWSLDVWSRKGPGCDRLLASRGSRRVGGLSNRRAGGCTQARRSSRVGRGNRRAGRRAHARKGLLVIRHFVQIRTREQIRVRMDVSEADS